MRRHIAIVTVLMAFTFLSSACSTRAPATSEKNDGNSFATTTTTKNFYSTESEPITPPDELPVIHFKFCYPDGSPVFGVEIMIDVDRTLGDPNREDTDDLLIIGPTNAEGIASWYGPELGYPTEFIVAEHGVIAMQGFTEEDYGTTISVTLNEKP